MKVAAIVPTFERNVARIVRAYDKQTHADRIMYLVDNNPEPSRVSIGTRSLSPIHLRKFGENLGASYARNWGIAQAIHDGCDAVCFWDDDDRPYPQYMARMAAAIEKSGKPLAACRVFFEGVVLGPKHRGTQGRMVRADAIGDRRWTPEWPKQDKRWWRSFDDLEYEPIEEVLIEARRDPVGGFRSPRAIKNDTEDTSANLG